MAIEESKDLPSLALDELIGNLKVHEVVMEKDSKIYRGKKERVKSIALKAKKKSSDDETLTSRSDDEEYAMVVRNFKKFFRRKCKFVRQPREEKKSFRQRDEKKEKSDRKCFRCGDPNHLISDCPKPSRNKDQKAFIGGKTPYEIFRGRKPSLEYFKVFGSKCFILNTKDYLTKYDPKSYKGVFLRYSQNSKAYVVLNKHTMKVKESLNVTFDESPHLTKLSPLVDDDVGKEEAIRKNTKIVNINNEEDESIEVDEIINIKESKNHPLDQVIRNLNQRILRSQAQNHSNFFCFISTIEPKNVNEALKDESWVVAMQEELNQFVANDVYELVPLPISQSIIRTKWVFRNKLNENGIVSRNKARLVAQGYNQQEGIDYDETYAPVACLESFRILLVVACANDFKLYKMDVKSAFLNGFINEEVYVAQPSGQSTYIKEILKKFGLEDSKPTKTPMPTEIKLTKDDESDSVDSSKCQGTGIETIVYADPDHTGDYVDHKSTNDVCTFMGCCLTSWFAKKQTALAIFTIEAKYVSAEYVSAEKACQQALWMKQALNDYGIRLDDVPIICDNKGAVKLSKNPVHTLE
nr:retrovirus-related Pol polyprotein from transposon TNT 1-94 [Tanacetum cinerariifolium]